MIKDDFDIKWPIWHYIKRQVAKKYGDFDSEDPRDRNAIDAILSQEDISDLSISALYYHQKHPFSLEALIDNEPYDPTTLAGVRKIIDRLEDCEGIFSKESYVKYLTVLMNESQKEAALESPIDYWDKLVEQNYISAYEVKDKEGQYYVFPNWGFVALSD